MFLWGPCKCIHCCEIAWLSSHSVSISSHRGKDFIWAAAVKIVFHILFQNIYVQVVGIK